MRMAAARNTAKTRKDDLLIWFTSGRSLPNGRGSVGLGLSIDGYVAGVDGGIQGDGEWFALGFANAQQALAILGEEFPVVEARRRSLIVAPDLYFAAEAVHP